MSGVKSFSEMSTNLLFAWKAEVMHSKYMIKIQISCYTSEYLWESTESWDIVNSLFPTRALPFSACFMIVFSLPQFCGRRLAHNCIMSCVWQLLCSRCHTFQASFQCLPQTIKKHNLKSVTSKLPWLTGETISAGKWKKHVGSLIWFYLATAVASVSSGLNSPQQ